MKILSPVSTCFTLAVIVKCLFLNFFFGSLVFMFGINERRNSSRRSVHMSRRLEMS